MVLCRKLGVELAMMNACEVANGWEPIEDWQIISERNMGEDEARWGDFGCEAAEWFETGDAWSRKIEIGVPLRSRGERRGLYGLLPTWG